MGDLNHRTVVILQWTEISRKTTGDPRYDRLAGDNKNVTHLFSGSREIIRMFIQQPYIQVTTGLFKLTSIQHKFDTTNNS